MSMTIGPRNPNTPEPPRASATESDPEKLKSTLKDNDSLMGEKYAALNRLQSLLEQKVNSNTATDEEKTLHGLLTNLKEGDVTDSELDQLSSLLGMGKDQLTWAKQFFAEK